VAAATAASPRLHTLQLHYIGPLADADLTAWVGVHALTVSRVNEPGFPWDGVRHLTTVRELELPLTPHGVNWAGAAFRGLGRLTRLYLECKVGYQPAVVHGPAGLFAPGSLPRSLRHAALCGLDSEWGDGDEPDGGAALLRPLAGVPDVLLSYCGGVGDGGLRVLAGATRLDVTGCDGVAGEHLEPLGGALEELVVAHCDNFTGAGLGCLAALRWLRVGACPACQLSALGAVAAGCPALERVDVTWYTTPEFDVAAAEAALLAAGGGGEWAFTHGDREWAATRRPSASGAGACS
jgi:hypothetical protein